jgi:hypothetical protein
MGAQVRKVDDRHVGEPENCFCATSGRGPVAEIDLCRVVKRPMPHAQPYHCAAEILNCVDEPPRFLLRPIIGATLATWNLNRSAARADVQTQYLQDQAPFTRDHRSFPVRAPSAAAHVEGAHASAGNEDVRCRARLVPNPPSKRVCVGQDIVLSAHSNGLVENVEPQNIVRIELADDAFHSGVLRDSEARIDEGSVRERKHSSSLVGRLAVGRASVVGLQTQERMIGGEGCKMLVKCVDSRGQVLVLLLGAHVDLDHPVLKRFSADLVEGDIVLSRKPPDEVLHGRNEEVFPSYRESGYWAHVRPSMKQPQRPTRSPPRTGSV